MRRRTPTFWALLATIVLAGHVAADPPASQPTTRAAVRTYEDKVNGFKLDYPTGWKRFKYKPDSPVKTMVHPADDKTTTVVVTASDTTLPPEQVGAVADVVVKMADGPTTNDPATGDGVAGRKITFTKSGDQPDGGTTRCAQVIAIHNGTTYSITYSAPADRFEAGRPTAEEIVKSFRWVAP